MMTWVSLKSGVASSGNVRIAHQPAMHAIATVARTASLFLTEKSMILLITNRTLVFFQRFGRIALKLFLTLRGAKIISRPVVCHRVSGLGRLLCVGLHPAARINHALFLRASSAHGRCGLVSTWRQCRLR